MQEPAAARVYVNVVVHAAISVFNWHADMSADMSEVEAAYHNDALRLFFSFHECKCSKRGVDTFVSNDGSLTQGSPSTRVVSSSDTAGISESTSIDTSSLTVDSCDSGAPQAKHIFAITP